MTIKTRITLIGILAVVGLSFLLLGLLSSEFSRYRQQQRLAEELTMISHLSALVHQLQIERGISAGVLAAPEWIDHRELLRQQAATDRRLTLLLDHGNLAQEPLEQRLREVRQRIIAGDGLFPEDYRLYSILIQDLLDQVWRLARKTDSARLKNDLMVHCHLMWAKEYLGRVRATINHCLRMAAAGPDKAVELGRLQALFEEYRRHFSRDAAPGLVEQMDRLLSTPEAGRVLEIMQAAARGEFSSAEVAAAEWFALSTKVIDGIQELEQHSLARLEAVGEEQLDSLRRRLLIFFLGTMLIGGGILTLVLYTLQGMIRSLDHLLVELGQIGVRKDFDRRLPVGSADEFGVISHSFNELLGIARQLLREKEHLAGTDQLTGLNNRRRFKEFLDQELARRRRHPAPLSLLLLDIDHFKQVNDTHGHEVGDLVLKELAKLLLHNVRRSDTPARWGGEEFLVLLPATDAEAAVKLAEKLRLSVEKHDFPKVGRVTASFGVASLQDDEDDESNLLRRVDQALYQAKNEGRNRVVHRPEA